jgi:ABC-type antimicrobial peptide transport system permease subunit
MARRLWPGRSAIGYCVRVGADTAPCRTVVGIAAGALLALLGGRWIGTLLFNESPYDPVVFGLEALVLLVAGLGASLVPGMRAGRVDPNIALRTE